MKKNIFLLTGVAAAIALASCGGGATKSGDADSAAKANEGAATYKVDVAASKIGWSGSKVVGVGAHNGTISLTSGEVNVENGKITAGSFVIDMNSINDEDLTDTAKKAMLEGHFKSNDFFNVAKYPTGKFEIVSVTEKASEGNTHEITGNLTLRDTARSITFPANIKMEGNTLTAEGKVTINRLEWGINYDKEKMSLAEAAQQKAKNGIVSKDIALTISLKAAK
jgi:polyisoprenoid-binding protein YceI